MCLWVSHLFLCSYISSLKREKNKEEGKTKEVKKEERREKREERHTFEFKEINESICIFIKSIKFFCIVFQLLSLKHIFEESKE